MSSPNVVMLHGAIRNSGDFLIRERAAQLLHRFLPTGTRITEIPRWSDPATLPTDVDVVVAAGGPALAANMVPAIHPTIPHWLARGVPVTFLAAGWSGAGDHERFSFDAPTRSALTEIIERSGPISVRDVLSGSVVERVNPDGALLTGCVAWFEPDLVGAVMHSGSVERIVFTPPAQGGLQRQALGVLREIRAIYPDARIDVAYHRGLMPGLGTTWRQSAAYLAGAAASRAVGARPRDTSGGAESFASYSTADLHVGYRVHAHLHFLSQRRPSILIAEDGRGRGQDATLGTKEPLVATDVDLRHRFGGVLRREVSAGFPSSQAALNVIDSTWPAMSRFVASVGQLVQ